MELFLVRHGQTDWNLEHRIQGRENIPLNTAGREEAMRLAESFARIGLDEIWSSPLSRAFETASIIATACGLAVPRCHDALMERQFGPLGGLLFADYLALDAAGGDQDGVESFDDLQKRGLSALSSLVACARGERILAVSHGALIDSVLRHFKGIPFGGIMSIRLKNCCVSKLRTGAAGLELVYDNRDAAELPELPELSGGA